MRALIPPLALLTMLCAACSGTTRTTQGEEPRLAAGPTDAEVAAAKGACEAALTSPETLYDRTFLESERVHIFDLHENLAYGLFDEEPLSARVLGHTAPILTPDATRCSVELELTWNDTERTINERWWVLIQLGSERAIERAAYIALSHEERNVDESTVTVQRDRQGCTTFHPDSGDLLLLCTDLYEERYDHGTHRSKSAALFRIPASLDLAPSHALLSGAAYGLDDGDGVILSWDFSFEQPQLLTTRDGPALLFYTDETVRFSSGVRGCTVYEELRSFVLWHIEAEDTLLTQTIEERSSPCSEDPQTRPSHDRWTFEVLTAPNADPRFRLTLAESTDFPEDIGTTHVLYRSEDKGYITEE